MPVRSTCSTTRRVSSSSSATGFSQKTGSRRSAPARISAAWASVAAVMTIASARSSAASTLSIARAPTLAATGAARPGSRSATSSSETRSVPQRRRAWSWPIRPAPSRATRMAAILHRPALAEPASPAGFLGGHAGVGLARLEHSSLPDRDAQLARIAVVRVHEPRNPRRVDGQLQAAARAGDRQLHPGGLARPERQARDLGSRAEVGHPHGDGPAAELGMLGEHEQAQPPAGEAVERQVRAPLAPAEGTVLAPFHPVPARAEDGVARQEMRPRWMAAGGLPQRRGGRREQAVDDGLSRPGGPVSREDVEGLPGRRVAVEEPVVARVDGALDRLVALEAGARELPDPPARVGPDEVAVERIAPP